MLQSEGVIHNTDQCMGESLLSSVMLLMMGHDVI